MPVLFKCPVCRKRLSVTRRKIGEKVKCPNCASFIEVPGVDQPTPPKVEFSEAREPGESAIRSDSGIEEMSDETFREVGDLLEETQFAQESETPRGGLETPVDFETASLPEQEEAPLEDARGTRPAAASAEPAAPLRIRRADSEFEEMDLTPMVDVTFLLLIFFMITASFTLEKTIPTPVPDPNEQSAAQPIQQQEDLLEKSILIGIESDNTITIDDEPVAKLELTRRLTDLMSNEQKAEALVTVADLATQETVVYVLDTANDVGMQKIRLASAPSEAD